METVSPPSAGHVIFREGLIFGVLLGIMHIVLNFLNVFLLGQSGLSILGLLLIVLLWLGMFFWSGVRAAKQTGRVGIGSLTGLVTAVFAGIIAFIATIVGVSLNMSLVNYAAQQISDAYAKQGRELTITSSSLLGVLALCGIVLWLLGIGAGAGMGALGGLLGRSQSTLFPPMYPANPPYGYGQPPMQPPYPPPYPPPYQNQPPPPLPNQPQE